MNTRASTKTTLMLQFSILFPTCGSEYMLTTSKLFWHQAYWGKNINNKTTETLNCSKMSRTILTTESHSPDNTGQVSMQQNMR